jgi:cation transport ATPase
VFLPILHRLRGLFDVPRDTAPMPTHVRRLEHADDRLSGEVTLIERLANGDCILLVPGDVIPCRGIVVDGFAVVRVDQSE